MLMLKKFFSGRLNRKQYIIRYLLLMATAFTAIIALALVTGLAFVADEAAATAALSSMMPFLYIIIGLTAAVGLTIDLKRFHDMNMGVKWLAIPAAIYILNFLPFFRSGLPSDILSGASLLLLAFLCIVKGDATANDFGEPSH